MNKEQLSDENRRFAQVGGEHGRQPQEVLVNDLPAQNSALQ